MKSAIELADITTEDPHAGLPEPDELGSIDGDLRPVFRRRREPRHRRQNRHAPSAPKPPRSAADPRISNSEGASFDTHTGSHIFANSRGFSGEYRSSYCSLSTVPVARDGESMERDYWYTMARGFAGLEAPEQVGPHGRRSAPCAA